MNGRRRFFLSALLGGGVSAALAGYFALPLTPEGRLETLLRARLDYLTIPDETMSAFVRDFMAHGDSRRRHLSTLRYAGERALYTAPLLRDRLPFARFERYVVSQFLMATDFFQNGADTSKPLRYVAFPDPYQRGCANHLARIA